MKVACDPETDSLMIHLRKARISESDEISPSVIADFDENGEVVSFEIVGASHIVDDTGGVLYEQTATVPATA